MRATLQELADFCASLLGELRVKRDFAGVCDVEAIVEIRSEADAQRQACAALAHKARVDDEEGLARLKAALADGIQPGDEPAIRLALRHFENSRRADHLLMEKLS